MTPNRRERIARLELSASCLQEAVERLHRLCPQLTDAVHERECAETAKNVASQVAAIRHEIIHLQEEP